MRAKTTENHFHFHFHFKWFPALENRRERERERARRDRTTAYPRSHHRPQPQIALVSSHPSIGEIASPEAPPKSHHRPALEEIALPEAPQPPTLDRTPTSNPRLHRSRRTLAPARSHPWPTYTQSLSFSIYLSLSLNCQSLSLPPSLCLTKFLSLMNVLFWFLFVLSLYIEIFYYKTCLETEKMTKKCENFVGK